MISIVSKYAYINKLAGKKVSTKIHPKYIGCIFIISMIIEIDFISTFYSIFITIYFFFAVMS